MANPTTNYGFVLPTSSDLVTDLPADFDVALQGVDTRLKALQPGTTTGDLAYSSATANTNTRLPIGTSGQVLAVSGGGVPAWTTTSDVTPLTTKGDLFTFTTVDARIGVGANNTVLTADSAEASGLKWAAVAGGSMTSIATGSLSGASVSITDISGSYKDLRLLIRNPQTPSRKAVYMQLNTDTTGVYGTSNSSSSTAISAGSTQIFLNTSQDSGDNKDKIDILLQDYTDTTCNKIGFINSYHKDDTTELITKHNTFVYRSTSAITSIQLTLETAASWSGGTYVLYGVN